MVAGHHRIYPLELSTRKWNCGWTRRETPASRQNSVPGRVMAGDLRGRRGFGSESDDRKNRNH
jgi:hypothetical protein